MQAGLGRVKLDTLAGGNSKAFNLRMEVRAVLDALARISQAFVQVRRLCVYLYRLAAWPVCPTRAVLCCARSAIDGASRRFSCVACCYTDNVGNC